MTYHGVKFEVKAVDKNIPSGSRLKELKYWCRKFHDCNLAPAYKGGSYGNLSFRIRKGGNEFIITGSKIGLKDSLSDKCFVRVLKADLDKGVVYSRGAKEPSSESMLHYAIYKKRADVNAIFHGHCREILCSAGRLNMRQTRKKEPYGTLRLVNSVLESLGKEDFIIMKGHGFISMGKTMAQAGKRAINIYNSIA